MKKYKFLIFLLAILLVNISCQKEIKKTSKRTRPVVKNEFLEYEFDFPDTVYINQEYYGEIKYKSSADKIITRFGDRKINRYVRYIMFQTEEVNYDFDELKHRVRDTFGARNNRLIPLYDIKFTRLGVNYLDGIFNDIILFDTVKNAETLPMKIYDQRVTHKVIVVESPATKQSSGKTL